MEPMEPMEQIRQQSKIRSIFMPMHYRQGPGRIRELPAMAVPYSSSALVLATDSGLRRLGGGLVQEWREQGMTVFFVTFGGECSEEEIERIRRESEFHRCGVIVGIGGGKLLDAAKSAAFRQRLPVVIVPTVASSDAPCSALSVIYDNSGRVVKLETHPNNPDVVLVDTEIMMQAPLRYLAAGMGDALSTGPEALACFKGGGRTILGEYPTQLGMAAATACDRILAADGIQAYEDAKRQRLTDAFDRVVEANTLLSGVGFESGGLAAAHSLHDGLTELAECHGLLHGEKVGFCTSVQAVLLGDMQEAERFLRFCRAVGLPVSLGDVGLTSRGSELAARLRVAAERTLAPEETIHQIGKTFAEAEVVDAFLETDRLSRQLFSSGPEGGIGG